ncbi:MAG: hypothetical protein V4544_02490 [Pseudomonadota bacterium]
MAHAIHLSLNTLHPIEGVSRVCFKKITGRIAAISTGDFETLRRVHAKG